MFQQKAPSSSAFNKKNYYGDRNARFAPSTSISKVKQVFGVINYKNIGILRNLINLEGKILSQRITRLQSKKQRQTAKAIKSSRVLGLLPFVHKTAPSQRKLRKRNIRYKSRNFIRTRDAQRRNTRRV